MSSLAVFDAAIRVISTHLTIIFENQNHKRKYRNKRHFKINLLVKDQLKIEFTAC